VGVSRPPICSPKVVVIYIPLGYITGVAAPSWAETKVARKRLKHATGPEPSINVNQVLNP
jgi:hypothetical protein